MLVAGIFLKQTCCTNDWLLEENNPSETMKMMKSLALDISQADSWVLDQLL